MFLCGDLDGKASYGDEVEKVVWERRDQRRFVEGEEDELEVAEPNDEEDCGPTKVERVEIPWESYEEVNDWDDGEEPRYSFRNSRCYVIAIH